MVPNRRLDMEDADAGSPSRRAGPELPCRVQAAGPQSQDCLLHCA